MTEQPKLIPDSIRRLTEGGFDRQSGGDVFLSQGPDRVPVAYDPNPGHSGDWILAARKKKKTT